MENLKRFLISRLKERSTWFGLISFLTAIGLSFSPEQTEAVVIAGVAFAGLIAVFTKDKNT